jgi:hypothetical protein
MDSTFDAALGTDSASFTKAIGALYQKPGPRAKFFKGTFTEESKTVDWDARTAPTFEFTTPSADHWQNSFDGKGKPPGGQPPADAFQLKVATLHVEYAPVKVDTAVETYLHADIKDGKLTLTPLSIWYDQSKFSTGDKFFIRIIIKALFPKAVQLLSGISVPMLDRKLGDLDLKLTAKSTAITGNHLVVLAVGTGTTPAPAPKTWPDKPIFLLASQSLRDLILRAVTDKVKADGSGKWSGSNATAEWKITDVKNIKVDGQDTTKISADVDYSFNATYNAAGSTCAVNKGANKS